MNEGQNCKRQHASVLECISFLPHTAWGLIYVAEFVSAAKRALSRMLLIIVCEGFGTVK